MAAPASNPRTYKGRAWIGTYNNPPTGLHHPSELPQNTKYTAYQIERAETGTIHIQLYVIFANSIPLSTAKKRLGDLFKIPQDPWHLEGRRGSHEEARDYCTKEETRIIGPFTLGEEPQQGKRNDLSLITEKILSGKRVHDLIDDHPNTCVKYFRGLLNFQSMVVGRTASTMFRNVKTIAIIGPTGVGKTHYVFTHHDMKDIYTLDLSQDKIWFDNYTGQQVLLLDDFYGGIKYHYILRLLDKYPIQIPVKGGFVWAEWTTIYITSNKEPDKWYTKGSMDPMLQPALRRRLTTCWLMDESHDTTPVWDDSTTLSPATEDLQDSQDSTIFVMPDDLAK